MRTHKRLAAKAYSRLWPWSQPTSLATTPYCQPDLSIKHSLLLRIAELINAMGNPWKTMASYPKRRRGLATWLKTMIICFGNIVIAISAGGRAVNSTDGRALYTWCLTRAVRYVFLFVLNGCTIQRRTYCVNSLCLSSAITNHRAPNTNTSGACITHLRNHTLYKKHLI